LRYIFENASMMDEHNVLQSSICVAGICRAQNIISVKATASIRDAFTLMLNQDITSVPIVDELTGECLSIVSMSDVRTFASCFCEHYSTSLDDECLSFVKKTRLHLTKKAWNQVVSAEPEEPLFIVLERMIQNDVHHVYVLNASKNPIGVISSVDIIKLLLLK